MNNSEDLNPWIVWGIRIVVILVLVSVAVFGLLTID